MSIKVGRPQSEVSGEAEYGEARPAQKVKSDASPKVKFGRIDAGLAEVEAAASRSCEYIFSKQDPSGFWCGELEADPMLEADYVFAHTLLGTGDESRLQRALTEILRYQNADGGWSIYPGGPSNISLSVKCYFAAKLMGMKPEHTVLAKAREWILANGGVVECNTFTKIYRYKVLDGLSRGRCSRPMNRQAADAPTTI